MLVVRLPSVFSGFGLRASSDTALSALYTLTRPMLDLEKNHVRRSCDPQNRIKFGQRTLRRGNDLADRRP